MYPFASGSVLVMVVIRFSRVKRSTTCFSIHFSVEFTCNHARAVSSVVRALASHARGGGLGVEPGNLATKSGCRSKSPFSFASTDTEVASGK